MGKYYTARKTKYGYKTGRKYGHYYIMRRNRAGKKYLVDIAPMKEGHYWWRTSQNYKKYGQAKKPKKKKKLKMSDFF